MDSITETVRERYAEAARRAAGGGTATCGCGTSAVACCDPITSNLYSDDEARELPETALKASLGCGNPTALADLARGRDGPRPRQRGGIDVILSARRVGPTGSAYGLDMTGEMLVTRSRERAHRRRHQRSVPRGSRFEQIPLPANVVDVIISNCVINLSADKQRVLHEAFRVLKPGGRFAVSDVVIRGDIPEAMRGGRWNCGSAASPARSAKTDYRAKLEAAGFTDVEIETTRESTTSRTHARSSPSQASISTPSRQWSSGRVTSAFVRARKPEAAACCGPTCCS